eukprot:maker-scaffold831_size90909-snap-gene-0.18 protein:Tk01584 transcript:maker-scaffold831_size90909-snap-gene-0.18-mRNA-1 annotation:"serine protease inhibitor family protein"
MPEASLPNVLYTHSIGLKIHIKRMKTTSSILGLMALGLTGVWTQNPFVQDTNSKLAIQLLQHEDTQGSNSVLAPFSVLLSLAMAYEGTAGKTRQEMQSALNFPANDQVFKAELQKVKPSNTEYVSYANMITVAKSAEVRSSYGNRIKNVLGSSPFQFEIGQTPEKARRSINGWVAKHSANKIKTLMPEGSITGNTKFVLANVVHYKSEWLNHFDGSEEGNFTLANGTPTKTDMLYGSPNVGYAKVDSSEVIEIPLKDKDHTFVVVLPEKGQALESVVQSLSNPDSGVMEKILNPDELEKKQAFLTMPKFRIEQRLKLKSALNNEAPDFPALAPLFSPSANFSRMAANSKGMYVDEIHHKAIITVDEKGLEAVGATGISITLYSAFDPELKIEVNRPFAFFIVNKPNRMILFAGKMNSP